MRLVTRDTLTKFIFRPVSLVLKSDVKIDGVVGVFWRWAGPRLAAYVKGYEADEILYYSSASIAYSLLLARDLLHGCFFSH